MLIYSILAETLFFEYVNLQKKAKVVLSDSGTITEESSILGFPALNVRFCHERPEGMEEGAVIMTGLNEDTIMSSLKVVVSQKKDDLRTVSDYMCPNVSQKVLRIILSYVDYVNDNVWKKGVKNA